MYKEMFKILYKWRWFILIGCLFTVFLSWRIIRKIPKRYYSKTVFVLSDSLEAKSSRQSFSVQQMLSAFSPSAGNLQSNLILTLLESDRMARDIIERFDLLDHFGSSSIQMVSAKLNRRISINYLEYRSKFVISVYMDDPQLSADTANFFVKNLNDLNIELKLSTAKELVKVIDPAEPAEYHAGPYLRKSVRNMFLLSLLLFSFFSIGLEYLLSRRIKII